MFSVAESALLFLRPDVFISAGFLLPLRQDQKQKRHKPANSGWTVGGDDEERANLQHRRSDHSDSDTWRPNVFAG